jgi:hypothetical protein
MLVISPRKKKKKKKKPEKKKKMLMHIPAASLSLPRLPASYYMLGL